MGFFGKKRSSGKEPAQAEGHDPYLTVLSASEANGFRALAREVFAEMGFEVEIHPDHAVDSEGRKFGFWNIAALCSGLPRADWRPAITGHLKNVLAGFDQDPFADLSPEDAAKQTYSRLYEESAFPSREGYPYREFAPGIVELLALDLPDSVAMFDHQKAQRFGGWEALRNQGIANLQGLDVERLEPSRLMAQPAAAYPATPSTREAGQCCFRDLPRRSPASACMRTLDGSSAFPTGTRLPGTSLRTHQLLELYREWPVSESRPTAVFPVR